MAAITAAAATFEAIYAAVAVAAAAVAVATAA